MPDSPDVSLIRRFLDGDCTAEEQRTVAEAVDRDASLRARLAAEEKLRERVSAVMSSNAAPAGLTTSIRQAWATPESTTTADEQEAPAPLSFAKARSNPPKLNFFALAASIAIILGAVGIGIFGNPLFDNRPDVATTIADVREYIANEHVRCAGDPEARAAKAKYTEPADVERELSAVFDQDIRVVDLSTLKFRFRGGGPCHVPPSTVQSWHMIYEDPDGRFVSIFIEPKVEQFNLPPDQSCLAGNVGVNGASRIWADKALVYMVVACNANDIEQVTELAQATFMDR